MRKSVLVLLASLLLVGCKSDKKPVATKPTGAFPQPETKKAGYTLLDADPEYGRLRLSSHQLIDTLPAYKEAVEKREATIRAKVGNISDPSLYKFLADTAAQSIPPVNKDDYFKLAEAERTA